MTVRTTGVSRLGRESLDMSARERVGEMKKKRQMIRTRRRRRLMEMFSVTDEAFAIMLVENYEEQWKSEIQRKASGSGKDANNLMKTGDYAYEIKYLNSIFNLPDPPEK